MLPLTKHEVSLLITLIEGHSELMSRATNASNNADKQEAWKKICVEFNGNITSGPRKPENLRLKWENLKKAARKRMAAKINALKTGDYVCPDDVLDRVAAILKAADGFSLPYGADILEEVETPVEFPPLVEVVEVSGLNANVKSNFTPTPVVRSGSARLKRSLHIEYAKSRTARNLAIADYFNAKKQKVELEIEKMKYEIEKLKRNK